MIIDCDVGFEDRVAALTKNNVGTVGRYYCSKQDTKGSYKIVSPKEASQLKQANVRLFIVHEASTLDLSKGTDHANASLQCAHDIGQPSNTAIYFGIEKKNGGFKQADMNQVTQYFKDVGNVIGGKFDIGIYSNGTPCAALLQAGLVKYTWLTAASYLHDGTVDFFASGRWTLAQVGPLDIDVSQMLNWKVTPKVPKWEIDIDVANGEFGAFTPNPPPAP